MKIDGIDHIVLTVEDIDHICDFYHRILGMRVGVFSNGRKALYFGSQKINLHQRGREFAPKAANPTAGSADLCLITSTPLPEVFDHLQHSGIAIIEGPVPRSGALGPLLSVYFYDPDGNLIEVASYQYS